ncbi:MAG: hypothetical protein ACRECV_04745 [Xanthobacteraceae bacterium]
MPNSRRKKKKQSRYADAPTEAGRKKQREAAFASIRRLYGESLPLWRTCSRGYCRRHHACGGNGIACVKRTWPLTPKEVQDQAFNLVMHGGPRCASSATRIESELRGFPPTNFVL